MALGNANTSAQSRGKNKPVIVKRRKEVVVAKNYNSITSSPVQSRAACGYRGSMSETFYHNGGSAVPDTSDVLYARKRARSDNKFEAGHYKITADGRTNFSIQVDAAGVIRSKTSC